MATRHGPEFWREHVENWCRSGLKQREYCANHGLGERAFHRWRDREKEFIAATRGSLTLVPVTLQTEDIPSCGDIQIEIRRQATVFQIIRPSLEAAVCAQWLREVLR